MAIFPEIAGKKEKEGNREYRLEPTLVPIVPFVCWFFMRFLSRFYFNISLLDFSHLDFICILSLFSALSPN